MKYGLTTTQIAALRDLADRANEVTGLCWPGMSSLSEQTCYARRTIEPAKAMPRELNLISRFQRPGKGAVYLVYPAGVSELLPYSAAAIRGYLFKSEKAGFSGDDANAICT